MKRFNPAFLCWNLSSHPYIPMSCGYCFVSSSSDALLVSCEEVPQYTSNRLYSVLFQSVRIPASFVPSCYVLPVASYDLFVDVLVFTVTWPCAFGCHQLYFWRFCHIPAILWRGIRCVNVLVYGHCCKDAALVGAYGIRSDVHNLIRTCCSRFHHVVAGCCHAIGGQFVRYQRRLI